MELHNFRIHLPTKFAPDQGSVEFVSSPTNPSVASSPADIVLLEGKNGKEISSSSLPSSSSYSELHFKNFTGVIRLEHITPVKSAYEVPSSAVNMHKTVGKSGSLVTVSATTSDTNGITTPSTTAFSSSSKGNRTVSSSSSSTSSSGLSQSNVPISQPSLLDMSNATDEPVQPTPRTTGKRKCDETVIVPSASSTLMSPSSPSLDDTSITIDAQSAINQALSIFAGMSNTTDNNPLASPDTNDSTVATSSSTATKTNTSSVGRNGSSKRSKNEGNINPNVGTESTTAVDSSVSTVTVSEDPSSSVSTATIVPKGRKSRSSVNQKPGTTSAGVLDFETNGRRGTGSGTSSFSSSGSVSQYVSPHPPEVEQAYTNLITSSTASPSTKILNGCTVVSLGSSTNNKFLSQAPTGRWGHAAAPLDNTHILVNGGEIKDNNGVQSDSYILDITTCTWKKEPQDLDAVPRKFHSLVHIPDKGWTVAFGGNHSNGSTVTEEGSSSTNTTSSTGTEELSVFDPNISLWYTPKAVGKFPSKRSGHTMTLVPKCKLPQTSAASRDAEPMLLIFGGLRDKGNSRYTWLNDLYVCEMPKGMQWLKWHHIATTEGRAPMPRCYHSSAGVGNKLVVFGGNSNLQTFDDVTYLLCEPTRSAPDTWSWHQPIIQGKGPGPRTNATATAIGDRFILITGGYNKDEEDSDNDDHKDNTSSTDTNNNESGTTPHISGKPYPDAWILDTERWEWVQISFSTGKDTMDLARAGHTAVYMEDVSGLLPSSVVQDYGSTSCTVSSVASSSLVSSPVTTEGLHTSSSLSSSSSSVVPGIVIIGGKKTDDELYSDIAVLVLPSALLHVSKDPIVTPESKTTHDSTSTGPSLEEMFPALANTKKNSSSSSSSNSNNTRELTAEEAWDMDFA